MEISLLFFSFAARVPNSASRAGVEISSPTIRAELPASVEKSGAGYFRTNVVLNSAARNSVKPDREASRGGRAAEQNTALHTCRSRADLQAAQYPPQVPSQPN
jgi:hypothetical protein